MAGGNVCRFFLEGRCKFGAQCKFRHPSGGAGGWGGGGGWNSRRGGGGRHQGDPVDSGRRWDQKGGNRFKLFSDGGGGGYNSGRGWDDRGQSQWRGGGRGGARGGGRGGWGGGGTRQSSNYQNQRYQNDQYQNDRYSGDRFQQNWSTRGGRGLFSDNQRSSNYQNSYQRTGRYGPNSGNYDSHYHHQQEVPETIQLNDPREIAAQIRIDMEEWNKSSMWPLSCYAYFKETPCLPGFADVSPEELRWEAYRAKSSGNSEQYLKSVSQLNDERLKVQHEFSNLTKEEVRDMLSGLKSSADHANSSSQSFFAPSATGTTVSSLFGNATPTSSLFGSQKQSSLFQSSPPPTPATTAQQPTIQPITRSLFGNTGSQEMLTKQISATVGLGQQQVSQAQTGQPSQSQSSSAGVAAGGSTKLTEKELEAFKADKFMLGQIPEHAPPEVLCN